MPKYIDIDSAYDCGTLYDWYISSVSDTDTPVWTYEHIEELLNDFYVIPKDTSTANVVSKSAYDQVLWEYEVALEQLKEIGLSFAEKPVDVVKIVRCKDCCYHQNCVYEENFKTAKVSDEKMFCGVGMKKI